MNTHQKARKDATTDQAEPHHEPAFEQIQLRAYEIYIQRGRQDGLDLDDWFQAEKELKTGGRNGSRVIGEQSPTQEESATSKVNPSTTWDDLVRAQGE